MHLVFVYGTLKDGFVNSEVNTGTRVPGEFVTAVPYPLYLVGEWFLPWLVDAPGEGHPVAGQLFRVDAAGVARMDVLERIGEAGWYRRGTVRVQPREGVGEEVEAMVYFGCASVLGGGAVRLGPLPEYTREHELRYGVE